MTPTIGRIVIYNTNETDRKIFQNNCDNSSFELPAIIVAVWSANCVNLQVFCDGRTGIMYKTSIIEGDQEGNWKFPVIVK